MKGTRKCVRWLTPAVVGAALSVTSIAIAGTARERTKVEGTKAPEESKRRDATRSSSAQALLTQKVLEMATSNVPLDEAVRTIFGSSLGPAQRQINATLWTLSPNQFLATGQLDMRGKKLFLLEIVPVAHLNYSLGDIEKNLVDFPFHVSLDEGHIGDDSMATAVTAIGYIFRVPGGQLMLYEDATIPLGTPQQSRLMRDQAYDVVHGKAKRKVLISRIAFRRDYIVDTENDQTLREYRTRKRKPGQIFRSIIRSAY